MTGLHARPEEVVRLFTKKRPTTRWSPSLQWLHQVVTATTDAITNGYVAPSLQHDGLRWRATWAVMQNEEIDSQVFDSILSQEEAILDKQMQQFIKVSEEIDTLSYLIACAANTASVY